MWIGCFPTYILDWKEPFNQGIVYDPERAYSPCGSRADRHSSRTPPISLTCRWWGGPPASGWSIPSFPVEQYNAKLHYDQNPSGGNLERRTFKTVEQKQNYVTKKKKSFQCEKLVELDQKEDRETQRQEDDWNPENRAETSHGYVTSDLAAAFCSCFILIASSFTGLGMKVMSAPSFTSRPIHQSLLYFCTTVKHTYSDGNVCC